MTGQAWRGSTGRQQPPPWVGRGGGLRDSRMKCPDVCVGGLKTYPFMKDAFGKKKYTPILKGFSAHFIPISWCNIKLKCVIHDFLWVLFMLILHHFHHFFM